MANARGVFRLEKGLAKVQILPKNRIWERLPLSAAFSSLVKFSLVARYFGTIGYDKIQKCHSQKTAAAFETFWD
jgi:hypothetical protein